MANTEVTKEHQTYWQRLKDHPGLIQVVFWPVVGALIAGRDDWHRGAIAAVLMLVLIGSTVLWTARK